MNNLLEYPIDAVTAFKEADTDTSDDTHGVTKSVTLNARRVGFVLAGVAALLVVLSLTVVTADYLTGYSYPMLGRAGKALDVDMELNFPTYYSMLLLIMASSLLALIALFEFRSRSRDRFFWALLAAGFLFMSFDEIVAAHEKLVEPMRGLIGSQEFGMFYYAWVVPGILLVLTLAAVFLKFWLRLPRRTRTLFALSAALFLGGAIGVELIGGWYAEQYGKTVITYKLITTFEESLELAGCVLFVYSLVDHLAKFGRVEMRFERP